MQYIDVTRDNIEKEHICCAITPKVGESCVADKKAWMLDRFEDGLTFKKLDVRAKVFIEYIPAEKAWAPIDAPGCMHVNCLWVSGSYKLHGYGSQLLELCKQDAVEKGKTGLTVITTAKKQPFLSDGHFLKHKGFQVADAADPHFELLYLPLGDGPLPRFHDNVRSGHIEESGLVLYYTNQCPYTNTYAQRIAAVARAYDVSLTVRRLTSYQEAQASPCAVTTYSLYKDGRFITNEVLSERSFETMLGRWYPELME